jgi:hypothetical protein
VELIGFRTNVASEKNLRFSVSAGDDCRDAVDRLLGALTLVVGDWTEVHLRFHLRLPNGKRRSVAYQLRPQFRSRLFQKPYADPIERYLRLYGVKLA